MLAKFIAQAVTNYVGGAAICTQHHEPLHFNLDNLY
jgi:hypothetical protein